MYTNDLFPSYPRIVGDWVRAVGAGAVPPPHVDPSPAQQTNSVALTPSTWWESWPAQLIALAVFLTGFLSYPVVALIRRVRRRTVAAARPAGILAATGATAVIGFVAYFVTSPT
jgi:uncharacterized protein